MCWLCWLFHNDKMILHLLNYICYTINNQTGMPHIKTKNTLLSQSETDPGMNRNAVIPHIFLVASVLITREEMHMWSQRGRMLKSRGFTLNKEITTILYIHISIFTYPRGGSSTKLHWNTNHTSTDKKHCRRCTPQVIDRSSSLYHELIHSAMKTFSPCDHSLKAGRITHCRSA